MDSRDSPTPEWRPAYLTIGAALPNRFALPMSAPVTLPAWGIAAIVGSTLASSPKICSLDHLYGGFQELYLQDHAPHLERMCQTR